MDLYGPPLPPGYIRPSDEDEEGDSENSKQTKSESNSTKVIGPQMPSFLKKREESKEDSALLSNANCPIGPVLPPHLQRNQSNEDISDEECGPTLYEFGNEIDDINDKKAEIDKRAEKMKNKLDNKDIPIKVNEREEWMTVPDTSCRNQLGAISRCLAPSKSSSKEKERHSHSHRHSEKDKKTSEELKKYNKSRRSESLMDQHAKKLKKKEKEKKSKKKEERKAFDRDEMAVRQFTNKQVNSVIDKAKYLNSRFAPGNKQYL